VSLYDEIGRNYARFRREDPRIAEAVRAALGDARSVVNVGAGAGAYEPRDLEVLAVEPSATMLAQRPTDGAPAVQASAEMLPLENRSYDAAMALLTIHHWKDVQAGLAELRRVARQRIVILTWDQAVFSQFWLCREYVPELAAYDEGRAIGVGWLSAQLGGADVRVVEVPHDCLDGFACAYWRRPERYLDPEARAAISTFAALGERAEPGLARLAADLESGAWAERHRDLLERASLDVGYRLVVAEQHR
jgi:SAM-dependent methyltransferase